MTDKDTDKELLKLAAKAAELQIVGMVDKMIAQPDHKAGGLVIRNDRGGDSCWNPRTDDGDALRLAVKLGIDISQAQIDFFDKESKDPYAATRRAITRAAAEIGKAMP